MGERTCSFHGSLMREWKLVEECMVGHPREESLMDILTPTQFRVTILVGWGLKNTDIARLINTTEGVVKNFIRDIFARAVISNRVELALRFTSELASGAYDQNRLDQEIAGLEARAEQWREVG
jgi:DNA-binding NarL/FixJ family response regulator